MTAKPFRMELPFAPVPFRYPGKTTLVYESFVFNDSKRTWTVNEIDIISRVLSGPETRELPTIS